MKQRKTKRRQKRGSNFKKPKRVSQKQYGGHNEIQREFIDACGDGNLKEAINIYEKHQNIIDRDNTIDVAFGNVCFNIRELGEEGIINVGNWLFKIKPTLNVNHGQRYETAVDTIFGSNSINLVKWLHSIRPNALNERPYENNSLILDQISRDCNIEMGKFLIENYPNILNNKTYTYHAFDSACNSGNENCIEYMEWLITIEPTILDNTDLVDSIFRNVCSPPSYRIRFKQTLNKVALWIVDKNPLRYWVEIDIVNSGIRNITDTDNAMYALSKSGVLDQLDANTVSDIVGEVKANEKK